MEKNVRVVDENGNDYEPTWPRRAKGLVKNGRARFMDEQTICLASPPHCDSEAQKMNEQKKTEQTTTEQITPEYTIPWLLRQIAAIQAETEYLNEALVKLAAMSDGDSGEPGSPGNIQGQAKAEAFGDIVRCRETTNQQLLRLYEKMYDDLRVENPNRSSPRANR